MNLAAGADVEDIFVFGGGEQALDSLIPDELLISVIDEVFECDTFLSELPEPYVLRRSTEQIYHGTRVFHEQHERL